MNTQIYEEATDWIVRHREGELDDGGRRMFDEWLRRSPDHVRAYLEMSAVWEEVGAAGAGANTAEALIEDARAEGDLVAFPGTSSPQPSSPEAASPPALTSEAATSGSTAPWRARRYWLAPAASVAALAIAAGVWLKSPVYSTGTGEERTVTLSDGSQVELNARSKMRVAFRDHVRNVELLEGQALFNVAHDVRRPFVVQAGDARIRAVGTEFDVARRSSGTTVTVVEGRVAVSTSEMAPPGSATATPSVEVAAGEQVRVSAHAVARPLRANLASATAWTQHRLVFDSAPLTEVAEEFNRYNLKPLVVDDPRLADFHVSGVFSSSDPALLLRFLHAQPEIAVSESESEIRISKSEAAARD